MDSIKENIVSKLMENLKFWMLVLLKKISRIDRLEGLNETGKRKCELLINDKNTIGVIKFVKVDI